jgi:3-isopropylmalate/(R)-2-methylmalate dehydratase small subunit
MEKFITHTGIAAPLKRSNVDTDQIIPAVFLKRVTKTGFEDALFHEWRKDPEFVLNQEPFRTASVLVAGPDFGTGSSREHAVWALQNYGFKAVISPRFADIFRGNSGKSGLVAAQVDEKVVQRLWDHLEANPGASVTVDLVSRTVRASRTRFSKEPNPVIAPFSPRATSRVMVSMTASSACAAALRLPA